MALEKVLSKFLLLMLDIFVKLNRPPSNFFFFNTASQFLVYATCGLLSFFFFFPIIWKGNSEFPKFIVVWDSSSNQNITKIQTKDLNSRKVFSSYNLFAWNQSDPLGTFGAYIAGLCHELDKPCTRKYTLQVLLTSKCITVEIHKIRSKWILVVDNDDCWSGN